MSHFSKEQWLSYVKGTEIGRASMEAHLQQCDECMELYMYALEDSAADLPQLTDLEQFASRASAAAKRQRAGRTKQRGFLSHPLLHYTIAAGITIVLVGSGAFQQLFDRFSDLSRQTEQGSTTAISEQWTYKAGKWLDHIPAKNDKKEGKP